METQNLPAIRALPPAWNKGRSVGAEAPTATQACVGYPGQA
jgi:hypothetical protein